MRGSRNFRQGAPGPSDIKSSGNVIFCFFLVLNLFYRSKMVILFSKVPEGIQHFSRRRFQLFPGGGVQLLIFYRNPYILWFSRGPDYLPPSRSAHTCGVVPPYWDWQISILEVDLNMVTPILFTNVLAILWEVTYSSRTFSNTTP